MLKALHVWVRAGVQPAYVTVLLPTHHEQGRAIVAEYLEDLAVVLGLTGVVGMNDQAVATSGAKNGL